MRNQSSCPPNPWCDLCLACGHACPACHNHMIEAVLQFAVPREYWGGDRRAERQVAAVREVLALLDERVEILRRPSDPSLAAYFEGRAAGEMAGTHQAADAIRRALEVD